MIYPSNPSEGGFRPGRFTPGLNDSTSPSLGFNLPLSTGSGGLTKFNRTQQGYPKKHWIDAACVGGGSQVKLSPEMSILNIRATGRGSRQMTAPDKYGFPRTKAKTVKRVEGFQTGDIVKLIQPTGKYKGTYKGRISVRANGLFDIQTTTQSGETIKITAPHKRFTLIQKADGYAYS